MRGAAPGPGPPVPPDRLRHGPDKTASVSTALALGEAGHEGGLRGWVCVRGAGSGHVLAWPRAPHPVAWVWPGPRWVQCARAPQAAQAPLEGQKWMLQRADPPFLCQARCRPPPARSPTQRLGSPRSGGPSGALPSPAALGVGVGGVRLGLQCERAGARQTLLGHPQGPLSTRDAQPDRSRGTWGDLAWGVAKHWGYSSLTLSGTGCAVRWTAEMRTALRHYSLVEKRGAAVAWRVAAQAAWAASTRSS